MNTILTKYKFDVIWHFTDKSNVSLIKEQQGLISLQEAKRRCVEIPTPGGNEWSHQADRIKRVDEYVHLAFIADHPMLYHAKKEGRIPNPIWLQVNSSITLEDGVRFCSDVSNKSGVKLLNAEEAREQIDFEVLFTHMNWKDPEIKARYHAARKAEILIPKLVPIDQIVGYKNG